MVLAAAYGEDFSILAVWAAKSASLVGVDVASWPIGNNLVTPKPLAESLGRYHLSVDEFDGAGALLAASLCR